MADNIRALLGRLRAIAEEEDTGCLRGEHYLAFDVAFTASTVLRLLAVCEAAAGVVESYSEDDVITADLHAALSSLKEHAHDR